MAERENQGRQKNEDQGSSGTSTGGMGASQGSTSESDDQSSTE